MLISIQILYVDEINVSTTRHFETGMMRLKVPRRVRPVMPTLEAEPVEAAQKLPEEGVLLRRR